MPATVAFEQGARLEAALAALLPVEPHLAYANFLPVARRPGAAETLHRRRWLGPPPPEARHLVARDASGEPLAALQLAPRPFETEHVGLAMARVELPLAVAEPVARRAGLDAAYAFALARLAEEGVEHVALRCSTRDPVASWSVQQQGAVHVDTQVSWMASLTGQPSDEQVPPPLRLEVLEGDAIAALDEACWRRIADWSGRAFDRVPLVFDPTLPEGRGLDVYRVWTEKVMRGEWADAVLVARDGKEVVAFISMLRMDDVSEAADAVVCGRGLGATLPEYRGLFTAIQHEMIASRPLGAAYMENETQVATIGSINVYAKLGFRYLRSTSTFHWRPGPARRPCA